MKPLYEYAGNIHVHTPYSDGKAYHAEVAKDALQAGLDFVIVTDHNIWVDGLEGYYGDSPERSILLLVGEEIHDTRRSPQANHLLVYGAKQGLAHHASNSQTLIGQVVASGGFCYLAHPIEKAAPLFDEPALPWLDWEIDNYTGIELWNYMSEFKSYLSSKPAAIRAALQPEKLITGPFPETLALWDRLLSEGKRVSVIGGADAHATPYSMGPLHRVIFPYDYLFRCVNTHILTPNPLSGSLEHDRQVVLRALRNGHAFVAYDLPAPTRGFRFSAQGHNASTIMGGWLRLEHGVTLQIVSPQIADVRLLKDGKVVLQDTESTHLTYIANKAGAYRVEVYVQYKGKARGWIFSNPIFIVR